MPNLHLRDGPVSIQLSDDLDRIARRVASELSPGLLEEIELHMEEIYNNALAWWPEKTGRSRKGLQRSVSIANSRDTLEGRIWNDVEYSKYVKPRVLDGKSAFVELMRKPMRASARDIAKSLAQRTARVIAGR